MLIWVACFCAVLGVTAGCLMAMGVGTIALSHLLLALLLMIGTAFLISWPFLRNKTPPRS